VHGLALCDGSTLDSPTPRDCFGDVGGVWIRLYDADAGRVQPLPTGAQPTFRSARLRLATQNAGSVSTLKWPSFDRRDRP
jgi:hypothetical protein